MCKIIIYAVTFITVCNFNASVNSSGTHPPGQPRGICSRCQSRGWGIRNFIAARGLGISVPRGDPWAFDLTHGFSKGGSVYREGRSLFLRLTCRGRTLCDAWHIFCVWIIQRKVRSHPVKRRAEKQNQI